MDNCAFLPRKTLSIACEQVQSQGIAKQLNTTCPLAHSASAATRAHRGHDRRACNEPQTCGCAWRSCNTQAGTPATCCPPSDGRCTAKQRPRIRSLYS